jgi:hypothetical protein
VALQLQLHYSNLALNSMSGQEVMHECMCAGWGWMGGAGGAACSSSLLKKLANSHRNRKGCDHALAAWRSGSPSGTEDPGSNPANVNGF